MARSWANDSLREAPDCIEESEPYHIAETLMDVSAETGP
jgi:hypothetical protein